MQTVVSESKNIIQQECAEIIRSERKTTLGESIGDNKVLQREAGGGLELLLRH